MTQMLTVRKASPGPCESRRLIENLPVGTFFTRGTHLYVRLHSHLLTGYPALHFGQPGASSRGAPEIVNFTSGDLTDCPSVQTVEISYSQITEPADG